MWRSLRGLKNNIRKEHNVVAAIKSECIACTWSAPGAGGAGRRGEGRAGRGVGVCLPRGGAAGRKLAARRRYRQCCGRSHGARSHRVLESFTIATPRRHNM